MNLLLAPIALLLIAWAGAVGYLLILTLAAAIRGRGTASTGAAGRRFCILVPAHNEELLLGTVLAALKRLDYPADRYDVVVIADNCTDSTAEVAGAAGARVLVRVQEELRGKGYALDWALGLLMAEPAPHDAYIVMDADSFLSPDFLRVMDGCMADGARVVQARYDVQNVGESWRTRLMTCALALAHHVKPLGRMALRLSDGLKGNGMCFARDVLEQVPWSGESVTEDIEYTIRLVCAGIRVVYTPHAVVLAQMPTTTAQASSQRERWEGGRYALFRKAVALLITGVRARRPILVDRALELIIPPFAEMLLVPATLAAVCALLSPVPGLGAAARLLAAGWLVVLAGEVIYLAWGLALARVPLAVAASLAFAPFYIVWKLGVYVGLATKRGVKSWRRTERHSLSDGN